MDEDGDANDEVNGDEGSDVGREREEASEEGQEVDQDENEEGMGELEEDNLREIAVAAGSRGKVGAFSPFFPSLAVFLSFWFLVVVFVLSSLFIPSVGVIPATQRVARTRLSTINTNRAIARP